MSLPGLNELDNIFSSSVSRTGQSSDFSLTLATVKDIKDEKKLNRVKCLPIGVENEEMSDWCYVMTPMSGPERGLFMFPQVGDLVVLGYLKNDPHRPIVLGGFWNSESKPPVTISDGKAEDYCLKTPNKVEMTLHDEDKKQKITLTMPSGIVLEIDDEKQTVTTKNKGGDTSMVMKMKDGEVELKAKSKITLAAGNATITLEQNGNITLKGTGGDIAVSGKGVDVKAQGNLAMQGMNTSVKANSDLSLQATMNASLKGLMLKLN